MNMIQGKKKTFYYNYFANNSRIQKYSDCLFNFFATDKYTLISYHNILNFKYFKSKFYL